MQLLVHITNRPDTVNPILQGMAEAGISGATVVDCKGMLASLAELSVDAPPIFGSLRQFVDPERKSGKLVMVVLPDEKIPAAKDTIHKICGDLQIPNAGILFTLPVMTWEGVPHK